MPDHAYFANLIWQIANLLRSPYRPPQYERVMLPMTVLRRFDSVLAKTKARVLAEYEKRKRRLEGEALDRRLNKAAGQRFHSYSSLDFDKLQGDPDHVGVNGAGKTTVLGALSACLAGFIFDDGEFPPHPTLLAKSSDVQIGADALVDVECEFSEQLPC